jgi:hypothetical protein
MLFMLQNLLWLERFEAIVNQTDFISILVELLFEDTKYKVSFHLEVCRELKLTFAFLVAQVIVVGGGLSGLSAAHTVLERGGKVLLLDKNGFLGGNSTKATSGINGALTRTQQKLGIPVSNPSDKSALNEVEKCFLCLCFLVLPH